MNGCDLQDMTSWKSKYDMCVYVDNSVDLVDFSGIYKNKATGISNLSTKRNCKFECMVLNRSMKEEKEKGQSRKAEKTETEKRRY